MFEKYLVGLKSDDNWTVEKTIDEISTIFDYSPEGEVKELLLKHCRHNDPGVRRVAFKATAMHWSFPEAFSLLKDVLLNNNVKFEDDEVLDVVSGSIVCYKGNKVITDDEINHLFLSSLKSKYLPNYHKKQIYIGFLKCHDIIDVRSYARNCLSDDVEINMDLVCDIISKSKH